ncbi:MAG: GNAT family N-acetyltransferase [Neisseria sp.]|nr:GNAT family N-acetyltransferase [Neisseria sp.]
MEQQCAYQEVDDADLQAIHLFAKNQDDILAYARIMPSADGIKIGRVIVAPNSHGTGLARQLMQEAMNIALSFGQTIELQAQSYLHDFYQSFGFVATSDVYDEDGIAHIDMRYVPSAP